MKFFHNLWRSRNSSMETFLRNSSDQDKNILCIWDRGQVIPTGVMDAQLKTCFTAFWPIWDWIRSSLTQNYPGVTIGIIIHIFHLIKSDKRSSVQPLPTSSIFHKTGLPLSVIFDIDFLLIGYMILSVKEIFVIQ